MNPNLLALALCATAANPGVARLEVALETKLQEIKTACEAHDDWPVDRTLGLVTRPPSVHGHKAWSQNWWVGTVLKNEPSHRRSGRRRAVAAPRQQHRGVGVSGPRCPRKRKRMSGFNIVTPVVHRGKLPRPKVLGEHYYTGIATLSMYHY